MVNSGKGGRAQARAGPFLSGGNAEVRAALEKALVAFAARIKAREAQAKRGQDPDGGADAADQGGGD